MIMIDQKHAFHRRSKARERLQDAKHGAMVILVFVVMACADSIVELILA